ncbi:hypothetical protein NDU88_003750 [Pleurodeles waltl]|uniref:Uncharacterized protein n=1 Tax=Pleurodeles waltl TaxID=8319 RepID=A0AAV7LSV2_PLEWA|nr:hypothetical protein NDU88_003750 [Pleurodeles waltl]
MVWLALGKDPPAGSRLASITDLWGQKVLQMNPLRHQKLHAQADKAHAVVVVSLSIVDWGGLGPAEVLVLGTETDFVAWRCLERCAIQNDGSGLTKKTCA